MQELRKVKAKIKVRIEKYEGEPVEGSRPFEVVEAEHEQELTLPADAAEGEC